MDTLPSLFASPPAVYAVGDTYCVSVAVNAECTMGVECAGRIHYDHANGILRSGRPVHMATIPQRDLDRTRSYTVILRPILERKPYFTTTGDVQSLAVSGFRPVPARRNRLRLLNVADTHSFVDEPVGVARGLDEPPDLLLLNGDIPEDCGNPDRLAVPHLVAGRITGGAFPCVFARGNHDLRGVCAEQFAELTPSDGGRTYYEFRAGPVWGLVLDTGEDKADSCPEYGHMVCCEPFREEEEAWLREVVRRGAPPAARWRILVCHIPFALRLEPPFDIEQARYRRWCRMLAKLRPHAMLTGHLHRCFLDAPGGAYDTYGAPCPVVCSSLIDRKTRSYACGDVTLSGDGSIEVRIVDEKGNVLRTDRL